MLKEVVMVPSLMSCLREMDHVPKRKQLYSQRPMKENGVGVSPFAIPDPHPRHLPADRVIMRF